MRIKARWETLDRETIEIHLAKTKGERYIAPVFENGDSLKQLLICFCGVMPPLGQTPLAAGVLFILLC